MRSNQTLLPDLFPSQILIRWNMSSWLRSFHTLFSEHRRSTLICCSRSRHPPSHHLVSCIITEATSTEGHRNSLANFYRLGKNWLTKIQTFYTAFCFIWTKRASSVLLKKKSIQFLPGDLLQYTLCSLLPSQQSFKNYQSREELWIRTSHFTELLTYKWRGNPELSLRIPQSQMGLSMSMNHVDKTECRIRVPGNLSKTLNSWNFNQVISSSSKIT